MRVLVVNGMPSRASVPAFDRIGADLVERGVDAEVVHDVASGWPDLGPYDLLASHVAIPPRVRSRIPCLTRPRHLRRPVQMRLLDEAGIPTMSWAQAAAADDVDRLFDRWGADRLLLKKSWSHGGRQVTVFDRESIGDLGWRPHHDIFCAEVNPADGDVYKAEFLHGDRIITWASASPPLRDLFDGGTLHGIAGAYGRRRLHDFWVPNPTQAEALTAAVRARHLGMCSLDLMARPDGNLVAIELNTRAVATWWTSRFPFWAERYAAALHRAILAAEADPTSAVQPGSGSVTRQVLGVASSAVTPPG